MSCQNSHKKHKTIYFGDILPDKENIEKELMNKRNKIKKINEDLKNIIKIFNKIIKNMEILYNLCSNIINNYENKKRNYQILQNIKEFDKNISFSPLKEKI